MKASTTILAVFALGVAARSADAQAVVRDDVGLPMRLLNVTLDPGHTYRFRTDFQLGQIPGTATFPDTVLALRASSASGAATLAGADGCVTAPGGSTLLASCFTFVEPAGSTPQTRTLFLRAWRTVTAGQTRIWMQRDSEPEVELTSGPITFGGATMTRSIATTARLLLMTTHLPGPNTFHTIWSQRDEFDVVRIDSINGRISGTAKIDVPDRSAANLSGPRQFTFGSVVSTLAGPSRMLENEYYLAGNDVDGDGLSLAVESALHSCDRTTQVNGSFRCDTLPGCASPTSELCLASLRDTDHDGLRDDLEVFGFNQSGMHLARYGADPAHMDVMVELDATDQDPATVGCQSWSAATVKRLGGDTSATADFFADVDAIYAQAPARINPDGTTGIRVHYDVGVANPDPFDTRWGNFGGGAGQCVPSTCGYPQLWAGDTGCTGFFSAARRWTFRYGVDGVGPGGQTLGLAFVAGHASHHVHELGHTAKLGHAGPHGSAAPSPQDDGNYRPNYPSRMNYTFQDVGGSTASDKVLWRSLAFSDGALGRSGPSAGIGLSSKATNERCPLPGADLSQLGSIGMLTSFTDGCWNADWNRNGAIDSHLTSMLDAFVSNPAHRWSFLTSPAPLVSAPAVAVVNGVLLQAYPKLFGTTRLLTFHADGNDDCNARPFSVAAPGGAYPPCNKPGTELPLLVAADAVALVAAPLTPAASTDGAIVVWASGGALTWGKLTVAPAATATEATMTLSTMGTIATAAISTARGSAEPALVRVANASSVLLVYVNPAGQLVQRSLADGASTWSAERLALRTTGSVVPTKIAVSMTVDNGDILMAASTQEGSPAIQVFRLAASGSVADRRWAFDAVALAGPSQLRPSIASVPSNNDPSRRDLYIHFTMPGGWVDVAQSSGSPRVWRHEGYLGAQLVRTAPSTVYDERHADRSGLRVFRSLGLVCASDVDCSGEPAASGAAVCNVAAGMCSSTATGEPFVRIVQEPFANGPEPGIYTDYDDWTAMKWGFCSSLQDVNGLAPSTVDLYNPRAYNSGVDCGPAPVYAEP